jgi:hypothetical protein
MPKEENLPKKELFSYKVEMVVHVFAEDEPQAQEKLDKDGGFVSKRETFLIDKTELPCV